MRRRRRRRRRRHFLTRLKALLYFCNHPSNNNPEHLHIIVHTGSEYVSIRCIQQKSWERIIFTTTTHVLSFLAPSLLQARSRKCIMILGVGVCLLVCPYLVQIKYSKQNIYSNFMFHSIWASKSIPICPEQCKYVEETRKGRLESSYERTYVRTDRDRRYVSFEQKENEEGMGRSIMNAQP